MITHDGKIRYPLFDSFISYVIRNFDTYEARETELRNNGFGILQTIENLARSDRYWAFHGGPPFVKDSIIRKGAKVKWN